jgi:hypothetical protein
MSRAASFGFGRLQLLEACAKVPKRLPVKAFLPIRAEPATTLRCFAQLGKETLKSPPKSQGFF